MAEDGNNSGRRGGDGSPSSSPSSSSEERQQQPSFRGTFTSRGSAMGEAGRLPTVHSGRALLGSGGDGDDLSSSSPQLPAPPLSPPSAASPPSSLRSRFLSAASALQQLGSGVQGQNNNHQQQQQPQPQHQQQQRNHQQPSASSPLRSARLAAAYPVGLLLSPHRTREREREQQQSSFSSSFSSSSANPPESPFRLVRRFQQQQQQQQTSSLSSKRPRMPAVSAPAPSPANLRRFRPGDLVLVSCHNYPTSMSGAARFGFASHLVNRLGYPPGQGETGEERSGPHRYVLATVKSLHFEEVVTYYTVTRCDTGIDQRADAEYMEPLEPGSPGERAAREAASASSAIRASAGRGVDGSGSGGGGGGGSDDAHMTMASAAAAAHATAPSSSSLGAFQLHSPTLRNLGARPPSLASRGGTISASSAYNNSHTAGGGRDHYSDDDDDNYDGNLPSAAALASCPCWCGTGRNSRRNDAGEKSDRDVGRHRRSAQRFAGHRCWCYCGQSCRNGAGAAARAACWLPRVATDGFSRCLGPAARRILAVTRRQAGLVLNGVDPYRCRIRITAVNLVVLCSIWFMFVDAARLAFFPPSADDAVAAVNLAVWIVLVLELLLEVFIRPDGYHFLIGSEKAFAPTTERYISGFHLAIELLSLLLFVPEFYCVLNRSISCGDRMPFSFYNAALMSVIGPSRAEIFYGHAYMALVRLRVFGLVRHWKNMWLSNTFINQKRKGRNVGFFSSFFPHGRPTYSLALQQRQKKRQQLLLPDHPSDVLDRRKHPQNSLQESAKPSPDPELLEQKKRERALTNASTIGTALMVTNSYRALGILWVIVGLLPIIFTFLNQYSNPVAYEMTRQMQATNLVASDNSPITCDYLRDSIWAWVTAVQQPGFQHSNDPYLLSLEISPERCPFQQWGNRSVLYCTMYSDQQQKHQYGAFANLTGSQDASQSLVKALCHVWERTSTATTPEDIAQAAGIRVGSVLFYGDARPWNLTNVTSGSTASTVFAVGSSFDASFTVASSSFSCFLLQLCFLIMVLGGLSVLRRDAEVLVLGPLRRMLKRVARYARNPLVPPKIKPSSAASTLSLQKQPRRKGSNADEDDLAADWNNSDSSDDDGQEAAAVEGPDEDMLGSYETEQLNSAVNKITDLLRKCWGVAGADIISTNLAARGGALAEMFNPTVPGKSVYALFGFVSINDFDHVLRELQDDVMILINDVAAVLHDEVFRWGFGDSGQCNKNLGSSFLMVFRIGLVKEVMEKLEQATDVVFSTKSSHSHHGRKRLHNRHSSMGSAASSKSSHTGSIVHPSVPGSSTLARAPSNTLGHRYGSNATVGAGGTVVSATGVSVAGATTAPPHGAHTSAGLMAQLRRKEKKPTPVNPMSLSLQSLPGITTFTDRAVIGMLKSFAGIYRDKKILNWNQDFRLGQGVGVFTVSMIFGMDAGWAVEGAVGSEYKIDATYLSPHVNMASRMMGACKQYGVTLMLSQAVQELMSDVARTKLRHLDTITVKGSSIKQRIYTYDARSKGVDFFLFNRTEDQADFDADRYTPHIWNADQDLRAMRQHVTDDFLEAFAVGRKAYLSGDWPLAIKRLERANEIMVETALEEGYLEDEFDALQLRAGEDARTAAEDLKLQNGDGPCLFLINFMKQHGGVAPKGWDGWHPLTRK